MTRLLAKTTPIRGALACGAKLVIGDEPLINNQAFVELIWGLKMAGRRFKVAG